MSLFETEQVIKEGPMGSFPKTQVASSLSLSLQTPGLLRRKFRPSHRAGELFFFFKTTTTTSSYCSEQSSKMTTFKFKN